MMGEAGDYEQSSIPPSEDDQRYRLDPAKLPQRLDLILSDELFDRLAFLSERDGRSINDLVTDLLSRHLKPL
jgi:hypothetical protein